MRVSYTLPPADWEGQPNRIDQVEVISVPPTGPVVPVEGTLGPDGRSRVASLVVPDGGLVVRARGRREVPDGPDLEFYTNPVRIVAAAR